MKRTYKLLSILLTLVMLVSPLTISAAAARETIYDVHITINRPVVGEALTNCAPSAACCEITSFSWTAITSRGESSLGSGADHTVDAKTTYVLMMTLEPMEGLYTDFSESASVTASNGTVAVTSQTTGKIVCAVLLIPMTRETEVEVSVPQPAVGAAPGIPTAADGHTVSDCTWYRSTGGDLVDWVELGEDEVFSKSYNYKMEATVTAGSNSLFDESTAVTVNGTAATSHETDPDGNVNTTDINIIYQTEHYYKGTADCTVNY